MQRLRSVSGGVCSPQGVSMYTACQPAPAEFGQASGCSLYFGLGCASLSTCMCIEGFKLQKTPLDCKHDMDIDGQW
jgi:hypothetical protein